MEKRLLLFSILGMLAKLAILIDLPLVNWKLLLSCKLFVFYICDQNELLTSFDIWVAMV